MNITIPEVPEKEKAIYEQLVDKRQHLSALKRDRSTFLKSKDVSTAYEEVLHLVKKLYDVRSGDVSPHNKVDVLIDEIFQVLSLCFMTVGLTNTAPATYSSLCTVQRLLEHVNESGVYTHRDIQPIKERLDDIEKMVEGESSQEANLVLQHKLKMCFADYKTVSAKIDEVPDALQPILNRLVYIRRSLMSLVTRMDNFPLEELQHLQKDLSELESSRDIRGDFEGASESRNCQNLLRGLVDECHTLINDMLVDADKVDQSLKPLYSQLIDIKTNLENLLVTRRWTLRETDLFNYQQTLQSIDSQRVDGFFKNSEGKTPEKGQSILLYLLRRCYAIIYKLLESSEPVSEALQPLHNQLSTVRRCLLEVKRMGGISSLRELYPYQMKLASLDNLRVDGKFYVDDQIPEGQGSLNALLAECFDICHELKMELDDSEEDVDEDDELEGLKAHRGERPVTKDSRENKFGFMEDSSNLPSYAASINESDVE